MGPLRDGTEPPSYLAVHEDFHPKSTVWWFRDTFLVGRPDKRHLSCVCKVNMMCDEEHQPMMDDLWDLLHHATQS